MPQKTACSTKVCPTCSKLIHARLQKHEECGWVMAEVSAPAIADGKAKKSATKAGVQKVGGINLEEIQAVKAVVDRLGAKKVRQLAQILAK